MDTSVVLGRLLIVAIIAVVYIAPDITSSLLESTLGLIMVAVGCAVAVLGVVRWRRTDRVLREGGPMPGPSPVLFVVAAIVMVSIALIMCVSIISFPQFDDVKQNPCGYHDNDCKPGIGKC